MYLAMQAGHEPAPAAQRRPPLAWAYGVTAVPARFKDLLPRTLYSLAAAGFPDPRLFVDGAPGRPPEGPVTVRVPPAGAWGNWVLALWELTVRHPAADRYLLVQDDVLLCRGLREYVEALPFPRGPDGQPGWVNLYAAPSTVADHCPRRPLPPGEAGPCALRPGWFRTAGLCKGALALVFDRAGALRLLGSARVLTKAADARFATRAVDAAVSEAFAGWGGPELCHWPPLVQHTGVETTLAAERLADKAGRTALVRLPGGGLAWPAGHEAPGWRGEGWDCRELLAGRGVEQA